MLSSKPVLKARFKVPPRRKARKEKGKVIGQKLLAFIRHHVADVCLKYAVVNGLAFTSSALRALVDAAALRGHIHIEDIVLKLVKVWYLQNFLRSCLTYLLRIFSLRTGLL
jgi:hypothetical protein